MRFQNRYGLRCFFSKKFVREGEQRFSMVGRRFKYPTGEDIFIKYEILAKVKLGQNSLKLPMLISKITDDCLLKADFLQKPTSLEFAILYSGHLLLFEELLKRKILKSSLPFSKNSKNLSYNQ